MKILVVSPDFPYPPNHGGRVDIWVRLQVLERMGITVDLLATSKFSPTTIELETVQKVVRNVWVLKRRSQWWHLLSYAPLQAVSRYELTKVKLNEDYDAVLLEGEYVEPVLRNRNLKTKKVFLRVHNDEIAFLKQLSLSTNNILKRIYYYSESQKIKFFFKKLYNSINGLFFISSKELSQFITRDSKLKSKSWLLPASLSKNKFEFPRYGTKVIFIGSLFMPNNQEAIVWYLENVHSLIKKPTYQLVIAGNSRGESLDWLKQCAKPFSNIEIYDSPDNLESLYAQSGIFINPMRSGAGVKLKTLEAIQNGLALVSTETGVEGTDLIPEDHFLLADDPRSFASQVERLLGNTTLQSSLIISGQQFLRQHYNHQAILTRIFTAIFSTLVETQ
jgi:polysaccharide biosynthesis protein PslH